MTNDLQTDQASLQDLQQDADRLEARRQLGAAAQCLLDDRRSMQRRLRDAAYPLSLVPVSTLPLDVQREHAAIWHAVVGPGGEESSHVLAQIDATLAGMTLAEMANLATRIVALYTRLQTLDPQYQSGEDF